MGLERSNVTAEPVRLVQMVSGSVPTCSLVVPLAEVVASTGKVRGTWTLQVFPVAPTVISVMLWPSADTVYEKLGVHLLK
jgi:hypothetical protein